MSGALAGCNRHAPHYERGCWDCKDAAVARLAERVAALEARGPCGCPSRAHTAAPETKIGGTG
jgi:hypothetical protein